MLVPAVPLLLDDLLAWFAGEAVAAVRLRFLELDPLKTFGLICISLAAGGLPLFLLCFGG